MAWALWAALWAAAQDPKGQEISGTVKPAKGAAKKIQPNRRYPTQSGQGGQPVIVSPAVVYIEKVDGRFEPPKDHPQMAQKDFEFHPRVLPIVVGTSVDFPNQDDLYHNVFSFSSTKKFDLGRYSAGETKTETFDKQGLVKVYCEIHEHMRSFILVLQNPHFAVADSDGKYVLRGVPPGRYVLKVWQEDSKEVSREIVVEAGQAAKADFELSFGDGAVPTEERCPCKSGE